MDSNKQSSFESVGSSGSPVCPVCQGIGDLKNPRGVSVKLPDDHYSGNRYAYVYMHYPSFGVLRNHAEAGCTMCKLLHNELKDRIGRGFDKATTACSLSPSTTGTHAESKIHAAESDADMSIATNLAELTRPENFQNKWEFEHFKTSRIALRHFSDKETGPRGSPNRFDIEVLTLGHNYRVNIWGFTCTHPLDPEVDRPPYRHLLSNPHIDLVNNWRQTCKNSHSSCNQTPHSQYLPTRVLKMDPSDENINVQLIETDGKTEGEYACLSYCWGHQSKENQIGQTLCENLEQYKQAIPMRELPNTVVDAIRLCCKLSFEYLWVDRLCIVQDKDPETDRDDWKIEASKMCDYYSKSALTISVPICSESSQSFLVERQKGFREQSGFAIMEYLDEESKSKSSLWLTSGLNTNESSWFLEYDWMNFSERDNGERPGWLGRGWTFQEWMFSPRVLHINGLTLWDCFNGYANELDHRQMKDSTLQRSPEEFGKESISWESIVVEYSRRQVTKRMDLLPALAGLAESYRRATKWTYLAGVWMEDMPMALLWQADHHARADRRVLADQTTPSWSWAHSNGPVYYNFNGTDSSAKASVSAPCDFGCEYKPPGSMPTVVKFWLDIDGFLSTVQGQRRKVVERQGLKELKVGDEWWESVPDDGDEYSEGAIGQGAIELLILAITKEASGDEYSALVLHECGRKAAGRSVFRRVGLASLEWPADTHMESRPPGEGHLWNQESVRII